MMKTWCKQMHPVSTQNTEPLYHKIYWQTHTNLYQTTPWLRRYYLEVLRRVNFEENQVWNPCNFIIGKENWEIFKNERPSHVFYLIFRVILSYCTWNKNQVLLFKDCCNFFEKRFLFNGIVSTLISALRKIKVLLK